MRRILVIAFFSCLIAPFMGSYIYLKHQTRRVRREVKHKLMDITDRDDLVLLSFTKKEEKKLKWKHSKEFEYKREMYDIVEQKINGDTAYYWCWWDNEETQLNEKVKLLTQQILGNNPIRKQNKEKVISFYKSLFYYPIPIAKFGEYYEKMTFFKYSLALNTRTLTPPTPPPIL